MKVLYTDGCCNKTIGSCATVISYENNKYEDIIIKYFKFINKLDFLKGFKNKTYKDKTNLNRIIYDVSFSDVCSQQNNGCELIAFCIGLIIGITFKYDIIYCDSEIILNSWSKTVSETIKDSLKSQINKFCIILRSEFENNGGIVEFISGKNNPADFGFHKK